MEIPVLELLRILERGVDMFASQSRLQCAPVLRVEKKIVRREGTQMQAAPKVVCVCVCVCVCCASSYLHENAQFAKELKPEEAKYIFGGRRKLNKSRPALSDD